MVLGAEQRQPGVRRFVDHAERGGLAAYEPDDRPSILEIFGGRRFALHEHIRVIEVEGASIAEGRLDLVGLEGRVAVFQGLRASGSFSLVEVLDAVVAPGLQPHLQSVQAHDLRVIAGRP